MTRSTLAMVTLLVGAGLCSSALRAREHAKSPQSGTQRINACALLPKEEVRKHLPWSAIVDTVTTIEEEPVGAAGSACEYPSVRVQLVPYSQGFLDKERQKPQVDVVAGVGNEAFFVPRVRQFAELYVRAGKHLLMLQASVPTGQTVDSIKPAVVNLAKALVAKLPS